MKTVLPLISYFWEVFAEVFLPQAVLKKQDIFVRTFGTTKTILLIIQRNCYLLRHLCFLSWHTLGLSVSSTSADTTLFHMQKGDIQIYTYFFFPYNYRDSKNMMQLSNATSILFKTLLATYFSKIVCFLLCYQSKQFRYIDRQKPDVFKLRLQPIFLFSLFVSIFSLLRFTDIWLLLFLSLGWHESNSKMAKRYQLPQLRKQMALSNATHKRRKQRNKRKTPILKWSLLREIR